MRKIIIPAAKLVPEDLWNVGKLPSIIYPINKDIVFDYLYKQYKENCKSFEIVCFEKKKEVHERLSMYDKSKIHIIDLDEMKDLGYTIYCGLKDVKNEKIIINFADTIVMDNIYEIEEDSYYYAEDYVSDRWTFFEEKNGTINEIFDKQKIDTIEKKKLFVGVFQILNVEFFKQCLEKAFDKKKITMNTFYYALKLYSEKYPMKALKTENWFDIGHADKYYNSKLEVQARSFNHIKIDKNRGILCKYSEDKEKFIGEILWYLKLPADLEYVRPRIYSYSTNYENPYVEMEYYSYHTIHELYLFGDLSENQWRDILKRILFICNDFKKYKVRDSRIMDALKDMYYTKTLNRFKKLKKQNSLFNNFFEKEITINGVKYKSLNDICEILKQIIPEMLYDIKEFNIIHGDLCFANIMIDNNLNFIKVIDPRGKFGKFDIYGDYRYELAKLLHSIDGKYDYIIKDMFKVKADFENCTIKYKILDNKRDYDLKEIFSIVFKNIIKDDIKKIELIEALLFLSMVPLHSESIEHQCVMLATAIQILDRIIDIKK